MNQEELLEGQTPPQVVWANLLPKSVVLRVVGAFLLLAAWLLLYTYIEDTTGWTELALTVGWLFAFTWTHVLAQPRRLDRLRTRLTEILQNAKAVTLPATVLAILTFVSRPWQWALQTNSCSDGAQAASQLALLPDRPGQVWFWWIAMLVSNAVYPVAEEVGFRRWMLASISSRWGVFVATITTSLLFALSHLRPDQFIFDFAFGVVLACTVIATGSLITAFVMHFAANLSLQVISYPLKSVFVEQLATPLFSCRPSVAVYSVYLFVSLAAAYFVYQRRRSPPRAATTGF